MIEINSNFIRQISSSLIGIPYKNFGRDPKKGLDCYGTCIEFYRRIGITLPDPVPAYDRYWSKTENHILAHEKRFFDVVQEGNKADLVACKILAPVPNHLMVVLDDTYNLNCSPDVGVHLLRRSLVEKYIVHYLRYKNLKVSNDPAY